MPRLLGKHLLHSALALTLFVPLCPAQDTVPPPQKNRPACDQERGLGLLEEQIDEARTLELPAQRIPILIRAADLLWLHREEKARAILTTAFDLAEKQFREKAGDQRFAVMTAIARHDSAWATQLTERVTNEAKRKAEKAAASATFTANTGDVSDNLVELALSLLTLDQTAAINLVRSTLRSRISFRLPTFLFKLAETNQAAADQLFQEALSASTKGPLDDLLYLSAYSFALSGPIGQPTGGQAWRPAPPNFVPRPALQQLFLNAFLSRGEISLNAPPPTQSCGLSEPAQIYFGLLSLEAVIEQMQPSYLDRVLKLKAAFNNVLPEKDKAEVGEMFGFRSKSKKGYEGYLDEAENEKDAAKRDDALIMALLSAPDKETEQRMLDLAKKISDLQLRTQLLNWLNFRFAQKATKEGRLAEAAYFANKVEEIDQRAYLLLEIAAESLKSFKDKQRAAEILNDAVSVALKASSTNEKARTLLGATHVFSSFDHQRALEVADDAIETINHLDNPDFRPMIFQRIKGRNFTRMAALKVEGFSLENTFRELGPFDFEGAVILARKLEDKSLRATAIITLSASCLEKPKAKQ